MEDSFTTSELKRPSRVNLWRQHGAKLGMILFWLLIIGGYYSYTRQNNLTIADSIQQISIWLSNSVYSPLFYMLLYALRPLLFFPATILTLLGGFLFGPIGIIYTIIGSNASAMVAYSVGRFFGQGVLEGNENATLIQRYTGRMRQNSFETILIMRLIFLPYDLVNYAAGFLKIKWQSFLVATAVGSVPGTVSIVLLGASFGTLNELITGDIKLNPTALAVSFLIIGGSIVLSRLIKKREDQQKQGL